VSLAAPIHHKTVMAKESLARAWFVADVEEKPWVGPPPRSQRFCVARPRPPSPPMLMPAILWSSLTPTRSACRQEVDGQAVPPPLAVSGWPAHADRQRNAGASPHRAGQARGWGMLPKGPLGRRIYRS